MCFLTNCGHHLCRRCPGSNLDWNLISFDPHLDFPILLPTASAFCEKLFPSPSVWWRPRLSLLACNHDCKATELSYSKGGLLAPGMLEWGERGHWASPSGGTAEYGSPAWSRAWSFKLFWLALRGERPLAPPAVQQLWYASAYTLQGRGCGGMGTDEANDCSGNVLGQRSWC